MAVAVEREVVEEREEVAVEAGLVKEMVLEMRGDGQALLETLAVEAVPTIHLPSELLVCQGQVEEVCLIVADADSCI